ncbi:unnamed protein product [Ceutorhynchus assimilis]|uniref:arginine kinase n=1 Tax=Ceutorhynchus assimilis TaxID=467358 RepID=A0A9N9QJ99_9CUCU|nr:unnamed protein product [Ceutorhynchus assimilis]
MSEPMQTHCGTSMPVADAIEGCLESTESEPIQTHCGTSMPVTDAIEGCLESRLERLVESDSKSLLKKFFTREIFDKLKMKTTKYGATLQDCIDPGVNNLELKIGLSAVDPDCYRVYADLFGPIIEAYHKVARDTRQPGIGKWGRIPIFQNVDPLGKYVVSTGVTCFRNLKGHSFSPFMTERSYDEMATKVWIGSRRFSGDLAGTYYSLLDIPENCRRAFITANYFKDGKRFIGAEDPSRHWPVGRGVYKNHLETFWMYVGEEDHVTIISKQRGGNDKQFAHISMSEYPNMPKLVELAAKYNMGVKEITEEDMQGVYELNNAKRFGCKGNDAWHHENY